LIQWTARPRIRAGLAAAALVAASLAGCSAKSAGPSGSPYGASTSELAVRGFLDGANAEDYTRMMNLFGTASGPAVEQFGVTNVEQRMIFLSGVLKHQGYELEQANLAQLGPDRVRWVARMSGTRKGAVSIPVVTVQDGSGRWFVERLNLDALTASITG
jgi:hypothetical protein